MQPHVRNFHGGGTTVPTHMEVSGNFYTRQAFFEEVVATDLGKSTARHFWESGLDYTIDVVGGILLHARTLCSR